MPIQNLLIAALMFLAQAADAATTAALCDRAAQRAALAEDVPLDVLKAIARVETGRTQNGALEPWPWTVNREGQGYWFASEVEAKSYVFDIFKSGVRSFDVGCFQINYRWHGKAFRSIDAMFDPDENATYAARFLAQLYAELGSWPAAAGAYHSRTQHLAASYSDRFQTVLAQLDGSGTAHERDPFTASASPLIPLNAHPVGQNALGSLVPETSTATAFIAFN
ncbi:transglycosylase SLT domain-containing protein [Ruegeria sp. SCSIO 43209]|uniref:transglycosylase SLT domain-containing protein n=1 Tax=Ruegeria sp. SCSIO 43209 TaxID=2793010 RepID=UPI001CA84EA8|nr:transglycosylase SLT domain-containing protein [Ruegeria sp. SCSIO 43209]UAB89073.1 transglycosylase SLT domain-containing protein [Ruegeria sp. SCSIO 43209]